MSITKCKHCRKQHDGNPCSYCGQQLELARRWDKPWCLCELCQRVTLMMGTRRCDRCWELEGRCKADPAIAVRVLIEANALVFVPTAGDLEALNRLQEIILSVNEKPLTDDWARVCLLLKYPKPTKELADVIQDLAHDRNVGTPATAGAQTRQEE